MRRLHRLARGLFLIAVTIVINSPVGALWLREKAKPVSEDGSHNGLLYEDEVYDYYSVHHHVWRKLRELFGLSDEEVQSLIFERHDFPPEAMEVTTSPAPNQGMPSLSPSPNTSPIGGSQVPSNVDSVEPAPTLDTIAPSITSGPSSSPCH
jgi:hypothetical protein